jgi:hypothetical protein
VVERSDTTGRLLPRPLHPEGVPATFLIRPDRPYFGELKKEFEIGPVISRGLEDQHGHSVPSPPTNPTRNLFWDISLVAAIATGG